MNGFGPILTAALLSLAGLHQERRALSQFRRRRTRDRAGTPGRGSGWGDAGFTTEYVLITALVVAAALTIVGIIIAKVTLKAQSIDLG
jgi:ABC-type Fe3+ transport system permease subunit